MNDEIEQRLIRKARRGDQGAFTLLFQEHHLALFRFAYRLTGSVADADDIVQKCFLGMLSRSNGFDPNRSPLRSYLFGAVRNQALKRLRRREDANPGLPLTTDTPSPETGAIREEVCQAVARAVWQLPDTQREVLLLAHYEQMSLGVCPSIGLQERQPCC